MNKTSNVPGTDERYTPAYIVAAAREAMGGIDLDPASSELANRVVRATTFFTREDDGLSRPWHGRVFLNHPYGRGQNARWADKLVEEYAGGNIIAAVAVMPNDLNNAWFYDRLITYPICYPRGRVEFWSPTHGGRGCMWGSVLVYLGPFPALFRLAFRHIGVVKI